ASPTWTNSYHPPSDFSAINQGQLKFIATKAYEEMQAKLPSSVWTTDEGTNLTALVQGFSTNSPYNYNAVNLGQVKTVAKPFYDMLILVDIAAYYPWSASTNSPQDYAAANIGQVKNLFGFDVNPGYLPASWQLNYFGQTGIDPNADPDGDG